MNTTLLDNVNNKEQLEKQLLFYSSFLMVFENLSCLWKQAICFLYTNCTNAVYNHYDIYVCSKRFLLLSRDDFYKYLLKNCNTEIRNKLNKEVYKTKYRGKKLRPEPLSIFRWMLKRNFICLEDYRILYKCHSMRNKYAHEIDRCLRTFISKDDKTLLQKMIDVAIKASQNWICKVTIPSHQDKQHLIEHYDSSGSKIKPQPENILSGVSIFYSLVLANLEEIIYE